MELTTLQRNYNTRSEVSLWDYDKGKSLVTLAQRFSWEVNGKWGSRDWVEASFDEWSLEGKWIKGLYWHVASNQSLMRWMNNSSSRGYEVRSVFMLIGQAWEGLLQRKGKSKDYYRERENRSNKTVKNRGGDGLKWWGRKLHLEEKEGSLSPDAWRRDRVCRWLILKEAMLPTNSGRMI